MYGRGEEQVGPASQAGGVQQLLWWQRTAAYSLMLTLALFCLWYVQGFVDLFNYLLRQRIVFLSGYVNDKVSRVLQQQVVSQRHGQLCKSAAELLVVLRGCSSQCSNSSSRGAAAQQQQHRDRPAAPAASIFLVTTSTAARKQIMYVCLLSSARKQNMFAPV